MTLPLTIHAQFQYWMKKFAASRPGIVFLGLLLNLLLPAPVLEDDVGEDDLLLVGLGGLAT